VSEDRSADAAGTPSAPVAQSLGEAPASEAPPTNAIPRPAEAPTAPGSAAPTEAPPAPGPGAEPTATTPATPAEPVQVIAAPPVKRRRGVIGGIIFTVVVVVLIAAIGYLIYSRLHSDPTKNAQAGQCLANLPAVQPGQDQEATGGKVVDCGDSSAVYKIESRLDNQTSAQAKSVDVCKASPDATVIYRAVPDNGNGYVLCLKKLG
jgi:hypothetical protein